jgi:hypothetical protein
MLSTKESVDAAVLYLKKHGIIVTFPHGINSFFNAILLKNKYPPASVLVDLTYKIEKEKK